MAVGDGGCGGRRDVALDGLDVELRPTEEAPAFGHFLSVGG